MNQLSQRCSICNQHLSQDNIKHDSQYSVNPIKSEGYSLFAEDMQRMLDGVSDSTDQHKGSCSVCDECYGAYAVENFVAYA